MKTERVSLGWVAVSKRNPGVYGGYNTRIMVYQTPRKALSSQKRYLLAGASDEEVLREWDIVEVFMEVPVPTTDGD